VLSCVSLAAVMKMTGFGATDTMGRRSGLLGVLQE
jgi:hypothetical protein